MIHALLVPMILAGQPVAGAPSHLVISSDGPKLRVVIDGKAYGGYTSKSVSIDELPAGKHDVEVSWRDIGLGHLVADKVTVYHGKLAVAPGVEMRVHAVAKGIEITDQVPLAKEEVPATPATPAAAPVQGIPGAPSNLHLASDKWMTLVMVDGNPLQQSDCTSPKACVASDVTGGQHEVEIKGGAFATKVLFKGFVDVVPGAEVYGKVVNGELKVYNVQQRTDLVQPAAPVAVTETTTTTTTTAVGGEQPVAGGGGVAIGMSFVDPDTGEAVHMSAAAGPMGMGMQASQSETTQTTQVTTTTVGGGAAPAPVSGRASIELTSEDGESFTVFVDGKKLATFNGLEGQSLTLRNLAAGEHKLEIRDFMENKTLVEGRLRLEPGFALKLGKKGRRIEAFNARHAWHPYR